MEHGFLDCGLTGRDWIELAGAYLFLFPICMRIITTSEAGLARAWLLLEGSRESDGLPIFFLFKTLVPVFAALLMAQGAAYEILGDEAKRKQFDAGEIDAEGKVLSYELVGRSGNADLDRATLDMIRRAQPLPKPPADMLTNGSVEITASYNYEIDRSRGRR